MSDKDTESNKDTLDMDAASSASGSENSNDLYVTEDPEFTIEPDSAFDEALSKLDDLKLEPDTDIPEVEDIESVGECSTGSKETDKNDDEAAAKKKSKGVKIISDKKDGDGKPPKKKSDKKPSVLERLKRMTRFEKKPKGALKSNYSKFRGIKVDRLPAFFIAKYLGHKDVNGVFGLEHVREPVDDFIAKVKDDLISMDRVELPLCYIVFSSKGIDIRPHPANKVTGELEYSLHPIDFISYGVQDMKYWRVFTFIVVKELSYKKRKTECHAFLADSTENARKMALALGACFTVYKRKLASEGKHHNFQVELRPPDELADDFEKDMEA